MSSTVKQSKQTKSSSFRKGRFILFLTGCALGAVCFLWVYGAGIINPMYDAWLFNGDMDLKQHHIGWCHYRMSALTFPVGMIETLSYPTAMSVIYTDSIPLLAFFFKLFRSILPVHFQYFGMFGLLSFMLMGGLAALLIHSMISPLSFEKKSDGRIPFVNRNLAYVLSAAASVIYILSFTVLQRMFYHTALSAQWIIILSLFIWMNRERYGRIKTFVIYSLMGILCVGIHTYYVPMTGSILLAASVEHCIKIRRGNKAGKNGTDNETGDKTDVIHDDRKKMATEEIINLAGFCATGLLTLIVFGAFHGPSGGYGEGLGSFTSNLNTYINPIYGSILIKPMKLYYDFQYEGYGYLGIGVFMLLVATIVFFVRNIKTAGFKNYLREHIKTTVFLCLFAVDLLLAILPMVTFSDKKLFGVPLPSFIRKAAGIFRSNGRFIWVSVYLIFTAAIVCTVRLMSERFRDMEKGKGIVLKILLVAVLFQVLDATKVIADKQAYFKTRQEYVNVWDNASIPDSRTDNGGLSVKYDEFVFLYNENDIIMDTAFYAYLNGMKLNNFYYARDIDDTVNANIEAWREEIVNGTIRDNVIYICKKDDDIRKTERLKWFTLDDEHLIGIMREDND